MSIASATACCALFGSTEVREKPLIDQQQNVDQLSIYGNGRAAKGVLFGAHHVFLVVKTNNRKHFLLEVGKRINVHMTESDNLDAVVETRLGRNKKARLWNSDSLSERVSTRKIQQIIDKYHDKKYNVLTRNCRTFVNDICRKCRSELRCSLKMEYDSN